LNFSSSDIIEYPVADVFATQRDYLVELAEFLPNVESIVIESREEDGDLLRFVNTWKAASTEIPKLIRPFVKPEMMKWTDYASWDNTTMICTYRIELGFLKEAIDVRGTNHMSATSDGNTQVKLEGSIRVDAAKIPGVPKFMAKKIGGVVEKFVVKTITPNLKKTNDGVRRYLAQKAN